MNDYLIQTLLSNLITASMLAMIIWLIGKRWTAPGLIHVLCVVFLIKLITPSWIEIPLIRISSTTRYGQQFEALTSPGKVSAGTDSFESRIALMNQQAGSLPAQTKFASNSAKALSGGFPADWLLRAIGYFPATLMVVAFVLMVLSLFRIVRFQFHLNRQMRPLPQNAGTLIRDLSKRMGLANAPSAYMLDASVAPFVWWIGGRVQLILPCSALTRLSDEDLTGIIAHELAHIKRRDFLVRWLEWFVFSIYWWNPLVWWIRKQMHVHEELACDERVIEIMSGNRRRYAGSLLNMAELLASSPVRPPAVASAINSGGEMETRLNMIISNSGTNNRRWTRSFMLLAVLFVIPFGIVKAQDFEAIEKRLGGAVEAGELTLDQAKVMLDALKKTVHAQRHQRELAERKEIYARAEAEIKEAFERGKMSKADATAKLEEIKKKLFGGMQSHPHASKDEARARELEARKKNFALFTKEIEEAVRAGKLSKQDAEHKLMEVREKLFAEFERKPDEHSKYSRNQPDQEQRVRMTLEGMEKRVAAAYRELEAAVKAGKLSKKEAEAKIRALKERMESFRESLADGKRAREHEEKEHREREHAERENREREHREREMKERVRQERIERDRARLEAEEREARNRADKESAERKRNSDRERKVLNARREEYLAIEKKIKSAVESGKMKAEEAEKKLDEIRKKLFSGRR